MPFRVTTLVPVLLLLLGVVFSERSPLCLTAEAAEPKVELLWENGAPGAVGTEEVDKPSLTIFLPPAESANGCGVVVCPGGGYGGLAVNHEGVQIAEFFNKQGVAAFMVKYRLGNRYRHPAPLQDVQRALRMVRSRATEFRLDPQRIGVMGFSAGGHLASTAATKFDKGNLEANDKINQTSCRPDFAILCYPVITFTQTQWMHAGSRNRLIGENPEEDLKTSLSSELQVTADTPPTFLFHTNEDTGVPPENSVLFYMALRKHKIPAELHIYEKGKHGVGLAQTDPVLASWSDRLLDWMKIRSLLKSAKNP